MKANVPCSAPTTPAVAKGHRQQIFTTRAGDLPSDIMQGLNYSPPDTGASIIVAPIVCILSDTSIATPLSSVVQSTSSVSALRSSLIPSSPSSNPNSPK